MIFRVFHSCICIDSSDLVSQASRRGWPARLLLTGLDIGLAIGVLFSLLVIVIRTILPYSPSLGETRAWYYPPDEKLDDEEFDVEDLRVREREREREREIKGRRVRERNRGSRREMKTSFDTLGKNQSWLKDFFYFQVYRIPKIHVYQFNAPFYFANVGVFHTRLQ